MLLACLNLLVAGRCLEAGDILAGHMRQLVFGVEKGDWNIARQFVPYRKASSSLIDDTWMDAAFKEAEKEAKREKRLAGLSKDAKASC